MHEWALAEAIISGVREYVNEVGGKEASKVVVRLGELQSIDKEILSFALNELVREMSLRIGEIVLKDEKAVFRCRKCGFEWKLKDIEFSEDIKEAIHFIPEVVHTYMKCPNCRSTDFEVVKGRGVWIESIEVVSDEGWSE